MTEAPPLTLDPRLALGAPPPRRLRPRRLPTSMMGLGVLGCLAAAPAMIAVGFARPLDALVATGAILAAIAISSKQPAALPTIVVAYAVFNRLVRRLLDYSAQEFSNTPPTSLVVPALGVLMGFAVLTRWKTLPKSLRTGAAFYGAALAYGAVAGVAWGAGMAFELLQWLTPFGFGLYVAWLRPTSDQVRRWVAAFGVIAVVGMAYGWVQWLLLPPWDEFWVRNCGMISIGAPEPMRCRFFGPFGAPGGAATVGAMVGALLITLPSGPIAARLPAALFLGTSAMMTGVRSACVAAAAMVLVWIVMRRGLGGKALVPLVAALAVGAYVVPSLPGGSAALGRMGTLSDLSSDGSLQGRLRFSTWAAGSILSRPFGHGLGSSGLGATRLAGGTMTAFDSGYLQPLYALGLPGAALLLIAISRLVVRPLKTRFWAGAEDPDLMHATRAMILSMALLMLVANALRSEIACFFWMLVLMAHTAPHRSMRRPTLAYDAFPGDATAAYGPPPSDASGGPLR